MPQGVRSGGVIALRRFQCALFKIKEMKRAIKRRNAIMPLHLSYKPRRGLIINSPGSHPGLTGQCERTPAGFNDRRP